APARGLAARGRGRALARVRRGRRRTARERGRRPRDHRGERRRERGGRGSRDPARGRRGTSGDHGGLRAGRRALAGRADTARGRSRARAPVRPADPGGHRPMRADGPRIVIVGAGGWVFPMELVRDVLSFSALASSTIVPYDIDVPSAERTAASARELIELGQLPARVEVPETLRDAVRGADIAITVFQVGGVDAYASDIEIPRAYGIDQTVGDTLGPGGIFRGLRTVPALREVAEAMLQICPDALLLNYANPMAINCWA